MPTTPHSSDEQPVADTTLPVFEGDTPPEDQIRNMATQDDLTEHTATEES